MVETTLKTLLERFRSKPEWQNPDPAARAEAVLRLPAAERETLAAIAREDADARVRRAAVKKLSEVALLASIASADADPGVREEAEARLAHAAVHEPEEATAVQAVSGLRDNRHLLAVAKGAGRPSVREAAVRGLGEPRALAAIVREAEDASTRLLALSRIEDQPTLLSIALRSENKTIAVAAVDRLGEPAALQAVADKARAAAAARRARARLSPTAEAAAAPPAKAPLPALDDEAERQAYEVARAAHEREAAARAQALDARRGLAESLETAQGEAIPAALEAARAAALALPPLAGPELEALDARLRSAQQEAEARHGAWLAGLQRRGELTALVEQAEATADGDPAVARPAFASLEAKWKQATAGAEASDLRARFEAAAATLHARLSTTRAEQAQMDQQHLQQLVRLTERTLALVAKGPEAPLREADHLLHELREALEHPGHFPSRRDRDAAVARLEAARKQLYPLVQQLREDAEWRRWANVSVQEELCVQAEALLAEPEPEKAAAALRELDARWKQAKQAPKEKAEALWTRFKAAREQVKSRTDAFFAKQNEQLAENLHRKEALCERAEALGESTDWLRTAEALRQLQTEWKAIGPVPRAASQRVWERFRRPCDRFFTRWQEHRSQRSHEWSDNLARKEALCERAEALAESSDWDTAAGELKTLQTEWRTIGAVKKSRSEAVWRRFRSACDRFFDRYKNRDEHAREAARSAREAICAELESLLASDGDAAPPAPDLPGRLAAAQTAWRQAGSLPHDEMAALEERFARARDGVLQAHPAAFSGTELDPEASRRKAEKLAGRVEALLAEIAPGGGGAAQTPEELVARLRDALATNTIGGRAAVEDRWNAAASEVEAAQAAWKRLGPLPGEEGRALAERFEQACRRFAAQRPRPSERPRPDAPRPSGRHPGPRPGRH
ncbi:MAG TPA: DUF349 domain-containing protein [Vicinamibacteria bacterium]|nr:DUF349 domain-containing protein [Vicinamibacteria bacterium]